MMLAALLLLCLGARAGELPEPRGDGAQRLVAGALKIAKRQWHADACLAGIELYVERRCDVHDGRPGRYNDFSFYFFSAAHPRDRYKVEIKDPVDPRNCPGARLGEYKGATAEYSDEYEKSCIREMSLDSGGALGIAELVGFPGASEPLIVYLRAAPDEASVFWKFPELRGKTFWEVVDGFSRSASKMGFKNAAIDAKTGKVLLQDKRLALD